jgi:hypothetical protein
MPPPQNMTNLQGRFFNPKSLAQLVMQPNLKSGWKAFGMLKEETKLLQRLEQAQLNTVSFLVIVSF